MRHPRARRAEWAWTWRRRPFIRERFDYKRRSGPRPAGSPVYAVVLPMESWNKRWKTPHLAPSAACTTAASAAYGRTASRAMRYRGSLSSAQEGKAMLPSDPSTPSHGRIRLSRGRLIAAAATAAMAAALSSCAWTEPEPTQTLAVKVSDGQGSPVPQAFCRAANDRGVWPFVAP